MKIGFDIGACVGESLDRFNDFDLVYSIEPCKWSYAKLKIAAKKYPNVKCHNIGISDENGSHLFFFHDHYQFSSFLDIDLSSKFVHVCAKLNHNFNNIISKYVVITKRLDTFMQENKIDHIDFLKIDTQGYDFKVIKGLGERLKDIKEIEVEVQIIPLYKGSFTKQELIDYMILNNFSVEEDQTDHGAYRENNEQDLIFKNLAYN